MVPPPRAICRACRLSVNLTPDPDHHWGLLADAPRSTNCRSGRGRKLDYTQRGVLDAQMRVTERLGRILAEHGMVLDRGSPLWFDGRLELPTPGEPWTMKLSCRGATASVEFTPAELEAFLEVRPPEIVSEKLRRAVDAIKPPKPKSAGWPKGVHYHVASSSSRPEQRPTAGLSRMVQSRTPWTRPLGGSPTSCGGASFRPTILSRRGAATAPV